MTSAQMKATENNNRRNHTRDIIIHKRQAISDGLFKLYFTKEQENIPHLLHDIPTTLCMGWMLPKQPHVAITTYLIKHVSVHVTHNYTHTYTHYTQRHTTYTIVGLFDQFVALAFLLAR